MRHLLIAVMGATPQILTEALWALRIDRLIPIDEITVITTSEGKKRVQEGVLDSGRFDQFCRDFGITRQSIAFDADRILVFEDADREPLEDIRTSADNRLVQDEIFRLAEEWTDDEETALHCSLAGGRKSMGYLLGSAMQFFGRSQDHLYHVLVSPLPFENPSTDFYYPPPRSVPVRIRNRVTGAMEQLELEGPEGPVPATTDDVTVELAEIPLFRLRSAVEFLKPGDYDETSLRATLPSVQQRMLEEERRRSERDRESTDLCLASSECFGIEAIKQATHPLDLGYFRLDWYEHMLLRLASLDATVQAALREIGRERLPELCSYAARIREFREEAEQIGRNHARAMEKLNELRCRHFRFGTSPNAANVEVGGVPVTEKIAVHEVEWYLPLHRVYAAELAGLRNRSHSLHVHAYKTSVERDGPLCWDDQKRPRQFQNYIVFGQQGANESYAAAPRVLPDWFEAFRERHFLWFGSMLLVLRRGDDHVVFDCTGRDRGEAETLERFASEHLKDHIRRHAEIPAWFLFEFLVWRQP